MCGRFALSAKTENIEKLRPGFRIKDDFSPRFNITPTQSIVTALSCDSQSISLVKWGLVPNWAKDETLSSKMINARSETIFEKPSFKHLIKNKRCLIFASGYYEWQKSADGKSKQPYYIFLKHEPIFTFAGIWDKWINKENGEIVISTSIITTDACEFLKGIHDRMPVIINENDRESWLDPKNSQVKHLFNPNISQFDYHMVSKNVNIAKNDFPELIQSIENL